MEEEPFEAVPERWQEGRFGSAVGELTNQKIADVAKDRAMMRQLKDFHASMSRWQRCANKASPYLWTSLATANYGRQRLIAAAALARSG